MTDSLPLVDPHKEAEHFTAIRYKQPIGDIFVARIPHSVITKIAMFDVRRKIDEERDIERYLGIQRPLNSRRVQDIEKYVGFLDATFPSTVIIAIDSEYCEYDEDTTRFTVRNFKNGDENPSQMIRYIARVIDGQHRIAGLFNFPKENNFDIIASIFVGSDISDQAHIFSTVNLEQTKVSRSLAYDLFELANTRSPQKTCHEIAVTLDADNEGPFYNRIKRLGFGTTGRVFEPLTQATVVDGIMQFISSDEKEDRDIYLRGKKPSVGDSSARQKLIFRKLFIEERDLDIIENIHNFFCAVRDKWPEAWSFTGPGLVLNRTNGYRALMRILGDIYRNNSGKNEVLSKFFFDRALQTVDQSWDSFTIDNYPASSTGEARLYKTIREGISLV